MSAFGESPCLGLDYASHIFNSVPPRYYEYNGPNLTKARRLLPIAVL